MTNLSYDPMQASGSANVAFGQSTGSQYQGADISDNLVFPYSGQSVVINSAIVFNSGITFTSGVTLLQPGNVSGTTQGFASTGKTATAFSIGGLPTSSGVWQVGNSGGGSSLVAVVASGGGGDNNFPQAPTGSGGSVIAAASGAFTPAGYFFIQVPTSGNPVVKVPFFNS